MRSFTRVLTAVAAVALAGLAGLATPATADPYNGEGCAGVPSVPAAYVCVISVTPTNALPDTSTGGFPVTVPSICYVAGCTSPTTVNVPIPGAEPGDGDLAVIWYGGTYYPIGVGIGGSITPLVQDALTLAGGAIDTVNGIVDGAPTTAQILAEIKNTTAPYRDLIDQIRDGYPEITANVIQLVIDRINELVIACTQVTC